MKKLLLFCSALLLISQFTNAQITFRGCTNIALGAQDYTLTATGTTNDGGTIRNTYESSPADFAQSCPAGVCEIRIIWNSGASAWQIQLDNDGPVGTPDYTTSCLYSNSTASYPNPPDLTLGTWNDCSGGACPSGEFVTMSGDVQSSISACTEPTIPTVTATINPICIGSATNLNISGLLNDATQWHIYTGSCGVNLLGTTSGSTFAVSPVSTTTYYIRGEGGCSTPGTCGTITINVNPEDDASFNYSASSYCANETDPTPTITGVGGGSFSSSPVGLSINPLSGAIDVSESTPTSYQVTYTTGGSCSGDEDVFVTITPEDDASFTYIATSFCADDSDPSPFVTGLGGGTFSAGAGLSINASTGIVDVSASTPGTYTVTYTTSGSCPNSSSVSVTINALDDASFSYSAATYCVNDSDPTPTITGLGGGTFSAGAGLSINASTGILDVSASTPGTYTVTYTTSGSCPNSSSVSVTVNALDDASFSYSTAAYCADDSDPTPTITGLGGGTFSAGAGLSINASTGIVDVSASTPGTYTVTYTTSGSCPNSSSVSVTINALDDASFGYSAAAYCSNNSDPTPTISGLTGGSFVGAPGGINLDGNTGLIDLSSSFPNVYTVTYSTSGSCPNSSNFMLSVEELNDYSVTPANAIICSGTNTNIDLGSSQTFVRYTLRDDANDTIVDGPKMGTGGVVLFNTGNISSTMTYNVYAESSTESALNFTGNAGLEKVNLGTDLWSDNFEGTNEITVEAWIRRTSTGSLHSIIGNYQGTYPMLLRIDNDRISMFTNSSANAVGTSIIPVDTWTHVAGTYDGSVIKVYVNGVLDGQVNHSSNFIGTSNPLKIGGGLANNTEYFLGDISEVRLWNVAKSQAEISAGMNTYMAGNETGLIANYQFFEGFGTTASNKVTGNTYPGTLENSPTWVAGPFPTSACTMEMTQTPTVTVNPNPTVSFTAPSDICDGSSTLIAQGGGLPVGGIYSGSGVIDDGNGTTYSFDPAISGTGTHTITYTFTDGNGCTSSENDDIFVGDTTPPTVICQNLTIYLDANGDASIVAADIDGGSTDNCGNVTLGISLSNFTCSDIGTNNVILTATDENSNSDNCSSIVTVLDTISPTPNTATLADLNSTCKITSLTDPTATDNCSVVTVTHNATLPITTTTTITWTYTDVSGNSSTQTQEAIVTGAENTGTDVITTCAAEYTWIDGNLYTTDENAATFTLTNASGCDSVVTLNLTFNVGTPTSGTDTQVACDSFEWIDGVTYTASNTTATHTLTNAAGCDSVVTLDLTINTLDLNVTTAGDGSLTADQTGATYQWITCVDSSAISGATDQTFAPTTDGDYAVIVTMNNCSDTSSCNATTDLIENEQVEFSIFPNPNNGTFIIELSRKAESLKIIDALGKVVYNIKPNSKLINVELNNYKEGIYFVQLEMNNEVRTERVVIRK